MTDILTSLFNICYLKCPTILSMIKMELQKYNNMCDIKNDGDSLRNMLVNMNIEI